MKDKHVRFAKKCPACCCGGYSTHKGCGGRWHERVVDDDPEEGYIHNYRCDKCFEEDYQWDYEDMKIEFAPIAPTES